MCFPFFEITFKLNKHTRFDQMFDLEMPLVSVCVDAHGYREKNGTRVLTIGRHTNTHTHRRSKKEKRPKKVMSMLCCSWPGNCIQLRKSSS